MNDQADSKKTPWMAGLFAGIFSSADGTWVPMEQLRRFSSVGAWVWGFGVSAYGIFRIAKNSGGVDCIGIWELLLLWIIMMILAGLSFWAFLWIGSSIFQGERKDYTR